MPFALDFICDVDDDGRIPAVRQTVIRANLRERAGGQVRIRVGAPVRSTRANAFYWAGVIGPIQAFLAERGRARPAWAIHEALKETHLPTVAVELPEEVVDFMDEAEMGEKVYRRFTTTRLDVGQFSLFCELVMAEWGGYGVDFTEPIPSGLRSGSIAEPSAQ